MNHKDALSILSVTQSHVTPEDIKLAYRRAAAKFHPDCNPAGLEMMKLVNLAYEALKNFSGDVLPTDATTKDYGDAFNAALNAIIHLGLNIEICGSWVWVQGDTKPHKDILKASGYQWSPKKSSWYYRPEQYKSFKRGTPWCMGHIRAKYGSDEVKKKTTLAIAD